MAQQQIEYMKSLVRQCGKKEAGVLTRIVAGSEKMEVNPGQISMAVQGKQRNPAKMAILAFFLLFALETIAQRRTSGSEVYKEDTSLNKHPNFKIYRQQSPKTSQISEEYTLYKISDDITNEYGQWHKLVRNLSQMELHPANWTPTIDWNNHPRNRSDRFPTIDERVQYYMGKWYNMSIPMHGQEFEKAIFIQQKTTREYGPFSDILVNLFNLDRGELHKCYENKKELHVFSPYCRDYIDLAILHPSEGSSASILHYIGDGLPYVPNEIRKYPLFAKVRPFCNLEKSKGEGVNFENKLCKQQERIEPILLPLNRKRHFGVAGSLVPTNDIPWEQKIAKAVWRGQYGKTHDTLSHTNDIKYALVSTHLNSTLIDAKFSKHTKEAPRHMIGSYMEVKDQLVYKYIISIEGNDVSSGLKWMLFSNSVVLAPPFTWESWAMEGKLEPFVHYIPLKTDMSNVEEMVQWAEMHPRETRMISERSTLFIYDLLFHHDAIEDEKIIMMRIMEKFEQNFGETKDKQNGLNIQWNKHSPNRALRFPSVKERVKYAMGKWYHKNNALSMKRIDMKKVPHLQLGNGISRDGLFIASGQHLSICAMANSTYSADIRLLCQSSLPYFDERNTADLKSNSFSRLRKSQRGEDLMLATESSWRHDGKRLKESKRVLLDDSIKILCYGDCSHEEDKVDRPHFARFRRRDQNAILWPLGIGYYSGDLVKSGLIRSMDIHFKDKKAKAVLRGGTGSSQQMTLSLSELVNSTTDAATQNKSFFVDETSQRKNRIQNMLTYRYLMVHENNDIINMDLIWMLASESVVLMPPELQMTSWFMEGFLKPYIHFVPVASDYSDIDEIIRWCEDNLEETKIISERATLFVYDMLLDRQSERENEMVKFEVMERYVNLFG
mmetsp:Transcript_16468/g.39420  ORF Transcript_16468/g.39420 Transcript_16468/m.39420 type:complete len:893 (-) Transcript_16468:105-2783(-)